MAPTLVDTVGWAVVAIFWPSLLFPVVVGTFWKWWRTQFGQSYVIKTILLALATFLLGVGILRRSPRGRAMTIALEVISLFGTGVLVLLPIGFNHGLVSLLVNAALPLAVIVLLRKEPGQTVS